jgi:Fe-S cluster assembly ATP-binding protein
MTQLEILDLQVEVGGTPILHGVTLEVGAGEVHAIMGPNGAGKSTLSNTIMGHSRYRVTGGDIRLGGESILGLSTYERARRGLFLSMQYPAEVPGVALAQMVAASRPEFDQASIVRNLEDEFARVGLSPEFLHRSLNVDFSGGEKKRSETAQLAVLRPCIAILDEIDSGLDIDALVQVGARVNEATEEWGLGVLAITHYHRLLANLEADKISVLVDGRIVETGDASLAHELEASGYARFTPAGVAP